MPPIGAIISVIATVAITALKLGPILTAVLSTVVSIGIGFIAKALAPKPDTPDLAPQFAAAASRRTQMIRVPRAARRVVIGEAKLGGVLVRYAATENKRFHHMVVYFCEGPVDSIPVVWANDQPIYEEQLDASGNVTVGPFSGKLRIKKHLGATDQVADADLIAVVPGLDANHRGRGCCYIYVRVEWDRDVFPTGLPNWSAEIRGRKFTDSRDGAEKWTPNATVNFRGYLADTRFGLGETAAALPDTFFNAAANVCDEFVTSQPHSHEVTAVDAASDALALADDKLRFVTGDRVQVTTTGTLPSGVAAATNYFVIVLQSRRQNPDSDTGSSIGGALVKTSEAARPLRIKLAASYADALAGTAVDVTDAGSGMHTVTKNAEPRYTANGVFELDRPPHEHLDPLVRAMAGRAVWAGGQWRVNAGAYSAPSVTFGEDDVIAPLKIQTKISRRDRFNAVKGVYVSPLNDWQPADFPAITSAAYEAADGGERIWRDLDLELVNRPGQAQRLGMIELRRARQEITVEGVYTLRALQVQAGENNALTNTRMAWAGKEFECTNWRFVLMQDKAGNPLLAVSKSDRETASTIYDWTAADDEETVDPAPNTALPSPFAVGIPGAPEISEANFEGREGSDVQTLVTMSFAASADALVVEYEAEFQAVGASVFLPFGAGKIPATLLKFEHLGFDPGSYNFRVRARNHIGKVSNWVQISNKEIEGLADAPAQIDSLGLQKVGGMAKLKWARHPAPDVRRGGIIEFRHHPVQRATDPAESTSIGEAVDGDVTDVTLPLKEGTYFVRAIDKLRVPGEWATVSTDAATILAYGAIASLVEDPTFPGTHDGTVVTGSILKLAGAGLFDDIPDLDAVADLDSYGGIVASGTYTFSAGLDLSAATGPIQVSGHVSAIVTNILDFIDDRTAPIDEWEDFDGNTAPGAADAWIEARYSPTNPAGTPEWTEWMRLDVDVFNPGWFEFRGQLRSHDPAYNIVVSELRVYAEELA